MRFPLVPPLRILGSVAHDVVHQHQGNHGFRNGRGAYPDARVVTPFGYHLHLVAGFVH